MEQIKGLEFLGVTLGLWLLQAMTLSNMASMATVLAGLATAVYHIYSTYKKSKEK
jgi:hypothetical protein